MGKLKINNENLSIDKDELIDMIDTINQEILAKDEAIKRIQENHTIYKTDKANIIIPSYVTQNDHQKVTVTQAYQEGNTTMHIESEFLKKSFYHNYLPEITEINKNNSIYSITKNEKSVLLTKLQALYLMFPVVECTAESFSFPLYVFQKAKCNVVNEEYTTYFDEIIKEHNTKIDGLSKFPYDQKSKPAMSRKQDGGRRAAPKAKTTSQPKMAPKTVPNTKPRRNSK